MADWTKAACGGGILAVLVLTGAARAQHIHEAHPESVHDLAWRRTSLELNWRGPFEIEEELPKPEVAVHATRRNGTCFPVTWTLSTGYSREHSVNVSATVTIGGEVEATAKSLAAELKLKAHAQVELGGEYTATTTVTYQINDSISLPGCSAVEFEESITRFRAVGSVEVADHRIICTNLDSGATWEGFCNRVTLSGVGVGYVRSDGWWRQLTPPEGCDCRCDRTLPAIEPEGETLLSDPEPICPSVFPHERPAEDSELRGGIEQD